MTLQSHAGLRDHWEEQIKAMQKANASTPSVNESLAAIMTALRCLEGVSACSVPEDAHDALSADSFDLVM